MGTSLFIIAILVAGLILGTIARFLIPGEQRLSLAETTIIGMIGAAIGGGAVNLLTGNADPDRLEVSTVIGAIAASVIVLAISSSLPRDSNGAAHRRGRSATSSSRASPQPSSSSRPPGSICTPDQGTTRLSSRSQRRSQDSSTPRAGCSSLVWMTMESLSVLTRTS